MSTDHNPDLLKFAEKVSDAEPVDWQDASGSYPALEPALAGLQRVEAVAEAFRSVPHDVTETDPIGTRTWGRLEVFELIGAGSFGEVFRARDPLLDRDVALKLRKPSSSDDETSHRRALDEGKRLARVRHPNVLTVHGADVNQGRMGVWTELVDGTNLRNTIGQHGPLDPTEAVHVAVSVCRALNAVHEADLVHGDVKASNIFRDSDGRVVLGDFGSAAELDSSGTISGSPVTLAPERLRGAPAEPASDVYSVGVLLYYMLSGRYPVEGADLDDLLERHQVHGPIPLGIPRPDLPAKLCEIVDRAVDPDPARRYSTAREIEHALEQSLTTENRPTKAVGGVVKRSHRRPIRVWSAILAAAAMAAVVFLVRAVSSPPVAGQPLAEARLMLDAAGGAVTLEDGASIEPGDHLFLEIEADAPIHVYVANEDETGAVFTLFPIPGLDLANPLPAGRHRLPGTIGGAANDWQVTSAGGVETFLVVASAAPIPEIEHRISSWTAASAERAVSIASERVPRLRGVGGLSTAPGATGEGARLDELQHQLSTMEKNGDSIWSRRIVLNTPN